MREFIVTSDQMKTIAEAVSETIGRPITEVVVSGDKLPEIVRCRDCNHYATNIHGSYCKKSITQVGDSNGFCAWGVRKDIG